MAQNEGFTSVLLPRAKYLLFTSCKGGVGKSTCAVGTAIALANAGKKVLLCDCDFEMRCLDLLLGLEDRVIYDLYDAATDRIPISRAIISHDRIDGLSFIAAPYLKGNELSSDDLYDFFAKAMEHGRYDYVLIDTHGSMAPDSLLGTRLITTAIIVASHQPSSIRAADLTADYLSKHHIGEVRLLINNFDFDGAISRNRPGINEIIDRTFTRLCGIVPTDRRLMLGTENGELLFGKNTHYAFDNIARRLMGRHVLLFSGFEGFSVKRKINKVLK